LAEALLWSPLRELTALPRPPSWFREIGLLGTEGERKGKGMEREGQGRRRGGKGN